ncbi:Uncharacterised protein [Streptococcus pneumoniae]|nr:Uncharacterised protein [Streptococcus pneumoniae]
MTLPSMSNKLLPNMTMLIVIKIMPIIPMTAPTTNNSIMTKITPTANNMTDKILTSPCIRKPKNMINKANEAIIPIKLILLEYN